MISSSHFVFSASSSARRRHVYQNHFHHGRKDFHDPLSPTGIFLTWNVIQGSSGQGTLVHWSSQRRHGNSCKLVVQETSTGICELKCKWKGQDLGDRRGETVASTVASIVLVQDLCTSSTAQGQKERVENIQTPQKVSKHQVSGSMV